MKISTPIGPARVYNVHIRFFRFRDLRSRHEVTSPIEIAWENPSNALKVTKTLANAQFSQKHILSYPFADSRGEIGTLTFLRSSEVTRGQKWFFDYNV